MRPKRAPRLCWKLTPDAVASPPPVAYVRGVFALVAAVLRGFSIVDELGRHPSAANRQQTLCVWPSRAVVLRGSWYRSMQVARKGERFTDGSARHRMQEFKMDNENGTARHPIYDRDDHCIFHGGNCPCDDMACSQHRANDARHCAG